VKKCLLPRPNIELDLSDLKINGVDRTGVISRSKIQKTSYGYEYEKKPWKLALSRFTNDG